ncbi:MAG TPA: ABC transporter ATP-binding protein [Anaerolineae bacterium]|nr:ABC transporter ATP-binding protein [Anaerolineae bacterium]
MATTSTTPDIIVKAAQLSKELGGQVAVQDLTFQIPRGVIFGFIGPSGAGKTTTIRLLTGIYAPTSGELTVLGRRPSSFTGRERQRIGYMAQFFNLYPDLTVWENLNFSASLYGLSPFRSRRLNELLEFVELREHKRKRARELSGGMQRRLNLAATLVHNPDLIFLDEPTTGLDPILREKLWGAFRRLRDEGHTLLITTQYMGEAAACDLIGVLSDQHLIAVATPQGLRHQALGGDVVDLATEENLTYQHVQELRLLPFVRGVTRLPGENSVRLIVDEAGTASPALSDWGRAHQLTIKTVEEYVPPFDEVFVTLIKQQEPERA